MYVFKQKLNLSELVDQSHEEMRVLLVEPDEDLAGLYCWHLRNSDFLVLHSKQLLELEPVVEKFQPHAVVLSWQTYDRPERIITLISRSRKLYPHLPIVTTAYRLDPELLKSSVNAGITSHIDRFHSKPADLVAIVQMVIPQFLKR